jgi:acyl-coenzyme A thioesterase PaaI-like protein
MIRQVAKLCEYDGGVIGRNAVSNQEDTGTPNFNASAAEAMEDNRYNDDSKDYLVRVTESGFTYQLMPLPSRAQLDSHAVFGLLCRSRGGSLINTYRVYKLVWPTHSTTTATNSYDDQSNTSPLPTVTAVVEFGTCLDGHPGTVHGGILALMMDDVLGFAHEALQVPLAVTANLNIDYRSSVQAGSTVYINAYLSGREGRKLYWNVDMVSTDDPSVLYCEASSLYVIPRDVHDAMLTG